jgi:hypothetical protein
VVVVLLAERFFVLEERSADFFLLTVFADVLLAVFTAGLVVGRDVDAPERVAGFAAAVPVVAIANIRGAAFLDGLVARTSRMALVCSSSVIRNS